MKFAYRQTDQLCAPESESCYHKHRAEAFESVIECSRIVPVFGSKISLVSSSTAVDDYAQDDEAYTSHNFDAAENEFNY